MPSTEHHLLAVAHLDAETLQLEQHRQLDHIDEIKMILESEGVAGMPLGVDMVELACGGAVECARCSHDKHL